MPYSRATQTSNLNAIRAKTCEVALYGSNPTANDTATEVSGAGYSRVSVSFSTLKRLTQQATMSSSIQRLRRQLMVA